MVFERVTKRITDVGTNTSAAIKAFREEGLFSAIETAARMSGQSNRSLIKGS